MVGAQPKIFSDLEFEFCSRKLKVMEAFSLLQLRLKLYEAELL
jgi:hypothetical protein